MSLESEFSGLIAELSKFQTALDRVQQGLKSPSERAILDDLLEQIHQAHHDAQSAVPAAIQKIHEVVQDVQQRAEEQRQKLAVLQQQIERRKQTPASTPVTPSKPELKLEPHLGATLAAGAVERSM
jgi:polyhydroxyalkanoate synthesis regulator phasin